MAVLHQGYVDDDAGVFSVQVRTVARSEHRVYRSGHGAWEIDSAPNDSIGTSRNVRRSKRVASSRYGNYSFANGHNRAGIDAYNSSIIHDVCPDMGLPRGDLLFWGQLLDGDYLSKVTRDVLGIYQSGATD